MRVKIVRQPVGSVNGLNLSFYKPRLTYDLPADVASYLVASGFARLEMRRSEKPIPPDGIERRRDDTKLVSPN
jgi:hypothetical protein